MAVRGFAKERLIRMQKVMSGYVEIFFASNSSWGFRGSVVTRQDDLANVPGRYGWTGGLGASASVDPKEDMIGILVTQRLMDSPDPPKVFLDFWTSAYQAMDD